MAPSVEPANDVVDQLPASVSLRDAYVRWTSGIYAVQVGQYKTPLSRYYLTSITAIRINGKPQTISTRPLTTVSVRPR